MSAVMKIFSPKPPSTPSFPAPPTKEATAAAAEAARQEEALRQAKRRGRGADLLTGPGGVSGQAPSVRKQLLGA